MGLEGMAAPEASGLKTVRKKRFRNGLELRFHGPIAAGTAPIHRPITAADFSALLW